MEPRLHDGAAAPGMDDAGRQARRRTRALHRDVDADSPRQVVKLRAEPLGRRVKHRPDVHRPGQGRAVGVGFGDHDGRRPDGTGVHGRQDPDRPGAGDQDHVAAGDPGAVDSVGGDRGRLDDRALQIGDLGRQHGELVLPQQRELGQSARLRAQPGAGEAQAQVTEPAAAVVTPAADDRGHDRHPVTRGHVPDARPGLDDGGGELVTQRLRQGRARQGVRRGGRDDRPHQVLVQVGPADAAVPHLDENVIGSTDRGDRDLLEADVALSVESRCAHFWSFPSPLHAASPGPAAITAGGYLAKAIRVPRTWLYRTAAMAMSAPWNKYCQAWLSCRKTVAFSTWTINPAPSRVPTNVPRPPSRLVPPSTTAVMLLSVYPSPWAGSPIPSWASRTIAPTKVKIDDVT